MFKNDRVFSDETPGAGTPTQPEALTLAAQDDGVFEDEAGGGRKRLLTCSKPI